MIIPYVEIEKKLKEKGLTTEQIMDGILKIRDEYNGLISSKDLLAYLLARKLGIDVDMVKSVSVSELRKEGIYTVEAYLVFVESVISKAGKRYINTILADETGYIPMRIFGSAISKWEEISPKVGDYLRINRVDCVKDNSSYSLRAFGNEVTFEKITGKKPFLEVFKKTDFSALSDCYMIAEGLCYKVLKRSYKGCSNCLKKIQTEDTVSQCCKVPVVDLSWVTLSLTSFDGLSMVEAEISPDFILNNKEINVNDFDRALIRVGGIYSTQDKRIHVMFVEKIIPERRDLVDIYFAR
ncbi:MAG: hypothetical protein QXI58_02600 [Candidatus Micrarchaeia archaeon]